jgi:hypothetical protein
VYIAPNGSATSAGVSVANNSSLTNASKIVMATNGTTDTQIISGINGSGSYLPMSFYTNNTLAMQITTGGIISAAGGGIQFPAVQIPSADANTLDDYEEGTFSPTVIGTSTAGTVTYAVQTGKYTKIGRLVHIQLFVSWSSGTGTGSLYIGGLPFASSASTYPAMTIGYANNLSLTASNVAACYVNLGTTTIAVEQYPVGGGTAAAVAYDASAGLMIGGCYTVD